MKAAIYVRISKDRTGAGLGVARQEADCRALAAQLGLEVTVVFTDNDLSAYSGKPRPGYTSLIRAVSSGAVDAVIVWHQDRLLRRTIELEGWIEACEPHGTPTYTVRAGTLDLSTPSGRAIARTLAAWASYEVETSTARVKAAKLQSARAGRFSGGQRPYGYEPGCTSIREVEAAVVRELVQRVIQGHSFRACALDLNARGIKTTHGKNWNALKVRNLLSHKRYAGIREHHDAEYDATWPAIIDRDTWDELQAAITAHARLYTQRGPARKFLLTGFAYCGKCGNRLNTSPRSSGSRYVCRTHSDEHGRIGCGGIQRNVAPVDRLITESILFRLESTQFARELSNQQSDAPELKSLLAEHAAQQARLHEISDDYATCKVTKAEYDRFKAAGDERLEVLRRQIDAASSAHATAHLPIGELAKQAWDNHDLIWRRHVVELLIEKVIIKPSNTVGMKVSDFWEGWRFKPEDVQICWRV